MDLKIGIFGPDERIAQAKKAFPTEDHVETLSFPCHSPRDIGELIDRAFMCDVYIFLDPLPYYYGKNIIEKKRLPTIKIQQDEYALTSTLFYLNDTDQLSLKRFSIDVCDGSCIKNTLHDLNINKESVYLFDYEMTKNITEKQIVNFHLDLWQKQKINFVLTASHYIYEQLASQDVPVYLINVPNKYYVDAIEEAKQLIHFKHHSVKRIVAGYIQLQHQSLNKKMIAAVQQHLQQYQHKFNTSLTFDGNNRFTLIGTRDFLNYVTSHLRSLPLIREIRERISESMNVHIGFGYGLSAYEAEKNAMIALENSLATHKSSCFIVNEREELIGPIGVKRSFNKPKLYNQLIHKARLNNQISYNFIQFISSRNNEPFSSEDIAKYYKVTKRSAERTIKKLINGNVITHVGEERPYIKGRPRKLFQLNDEIVQ